MLQKVWICPLENLRYCRRTFVLSEADLRDLNQANESKILSIIIYG